MLLPRSFSLTTLWIKYKLYIFPFRISWTHSLLLVFTIYISPNDLKTRSPNLKSSLCIYYTYPKVWPTLPPSKVPSNNPPFLNIFSFPRQSLIGCARWSTYSFLKLLFAPTLTLNTLLINGMLMQWKDTTSEWSSGCFIFDRLKNLSVSFIIFKNRNNNPHLTDLPRGLNITSYGSWSVVWYILGTK